MSLQLGTRDGRAVELPTDALLRHVMALGSSGSGKTVFCKVIVEEAVRRGVGAICIDPQGDLCSLAAGALDDEELRARGVDPAWARELQERIEVVVFTPGSDRGVPLCADPVDPALAEREGRERVQAISQTAAVVVGLLGFDLDSDDGAGLSAVLDRALTTMISAQATLSLAGLGQHLDTAAEDDFATYRSLLEPKKLRVARQRLARLDIGARRLLFHGGVPLDIDVLLGRDARAPVAEGRVRVAIIYLNTLHQQDDKDFFVAAIADRLYGWMLAHPSPEPQLLFYIDEVAPFIPPVRKPACKPGLSLLFKQARKYGVGCLMATQNPGDVDYRAMSQFGTWALGRLTTRQDLKKVEPTIKALAPEQTDAILARLPALKPGELMLISPDRFDAPFELRSRWLLTRHETWTDDRIDAYSESVRDRFTAWTDAAPVSVAPVEAAPPVEPSPPVEPPPPVEATPSAPATEPAPVANRAAPTRESALLDALGRLDHASVQELADELGLPVSGVRRALKRLVERGDARQFKQGRAQRYWSPTSGGRPDLGVPNPIGCIARHVGHEAALAIGAEHARSKVLGLVGEEETLARAEPLHRLVYRLDFEEQVERHLLAKMFGARTDERLGSVYLHPHNLGVLFYSHERGIWFDDLPKERASEVRDFDGVTELEARAPAELSIDADDWVKRRSPADVTESFKRRFEATCTTVEPLFVPLWVLLLEDERGGLRRVTIDGLVGKPVRWLPPS